MITHSDKAEYLRDCLFADFDGYQIELYASNGIEKTDQVYLEPSVLRAFWNYVDRLKESA